MAYEVTHSDLRKANAAMVGVLERASDGKLDIASAYVQTRAANAICRGVAADVMSRLAAPTLRKIEKAKK